MRLVDGEAVEIGRRPGGAPWWRRVLARLATGRRIADPACVPKTDVAPCARALWAGAELREIEVPADAPAARAAWTWARLALVRLSLPPAVLALTSTPAYRELPPAERRRRLWTAFVAAERGSPRRLAASVGLGVFMGFAPIWGFQLGAAIVVAHVLGLSKPVTALATQVSVPVIIPAVLAASLAVGKALLPGAATAAGLAAAWFVGSLAVAAAAGLAAAGVTLVVARTRT